MSEYEKVVACFSPVLYRVQKMKDCHWVLVGDFESILKAAERAKDIAQTYGLKSRVLEIDK